MTEGPGTKTILLHSIALLILSLTAVVLIFHSKTSVFPEPGSEIKLGHGLMYTGRGGEELLASNQQFVTLPDQWQPGDNQVWYQFKFARPVLNADSFSIYIPTIRQNLALYLNGEWLSQAGEFAPRLAQKWNHPQLFTLPASLLLDNNTLRIRVATDRSQAGYLSRIFIGDSLQLEQHWRWRHFIKVELLQIASLLMLVVALINLYLWYRRPANTYYFWYALAAICWSVRGYLLVTPVIPISD